MGEALAKGDFNGDGYEDLAVSIPFQVVEGVWAAGSVLIFNGGSTGLSAPRVLTQLLPGIPWDPEDRAYFGAVLASGDFNKDAIADLAIGMPDKTIGSAAGAGGVIVLYGSTSGLPSATVASQTWHQGSANMGGGPEAGDHFGAALAVGDFNGDLYADLAVGTPDEAIGTLNSAGAVNVIYGSSTGLHATTVVANQVWYQGGGPQKLPGAAEAYGYFGHALAAGDFNKDGKADLAIGVPGEGCHGHANVIYGSSTGLNGTTVANQTLVVPASGCRYNQVGTALNAGDFNGDGRSDLAVSMVTVGASTGSAGGVAIFYGVGSGGLATTTSHLFPGNSSVDPYGSFGQALASGDFNKDNRIDLAVGVPQGSSQQVNVLYGASSGLNPATVVPQIWTQDTPNIKDTTEAGDHFGRVLAAGDFNKDGYSDLVVGVPSEDIGTTVDAGVVHVIYGANSSGLSALGNVLLRDAPCEYVDQGDACMDGDGDGVLRGVERFFGTLDTAADTDGDGIPDGTEILGVSPNPDGSFTPNKRSDPKVKSLYVVLAHPRVTNAAGTVVFTPATLKTGLLAYFPPDPLLEIYVFFQELTGAAATTLATSCAQTIADGSLAPGSQRGWGTVAGLLTGDAKAAAEFGHTGRICVDGDTVNTVKGAIQYKGSSQFMVKLRAPGTTTPLPAWHRALASLTAHELGHSLGLGHGGDSDDDCSPLYPSVMNHAYDFQMSTSGTCSAIGFSKGVFDVPLPAKQLQIYAGSWEDNVLQWNGTANTVMARTGAVNPQGQPVVAAATKAQLGFLSCWAKGDLGGGEPDNTPMSTPAITYCDGATSGPVCADWNQDLFIEDEDAPYNNFSVFQARSGMGGLKAIVSGCAPADLNPNDDPEPPLPDLPLKDNDDFEIIKSYLATTVRLTGCGIAPCAEAVPVREPATAGQIDAFRGWW